MNILSNNCYISVLALLLAVSCKGPHALDPNFQMMEARIDESNAAKNYSKTIEILTTYLATDPAPTQMAAGRAYYLRGAAHYKIDSADQTLDDFIQAKAIFAKLEADQQVAETNNKLGHLFNRYDNHAEALEYYTLALAYAQADGSDKQKASYHYGVARSLRRMKRITDAQKHYFAAMELEKKLDRLNYYIDIRLELGNMYYDAGLYKDAREEYFIAINAADGTTYKSTVLAHARSNIGTCHVDEGQLVLAQPFLDSAIASPDLSEAQKAYTYNSRGKMHSRADRPALAMQDFRAMLISAQVNPDLSEIASTFDEIKIIFADQPDSLLHYSLMMTEITIPMSLRREDLSRTAIHDHLRNRKQAADQAERSASHRAAIMWYVFGLIALSLLAFICMSRLARIYFTPIDSRSILKASTVGRQEYMINKLKNDKSWADRLKREINEGL
jgi:tetratricopeptide (TPR) repeat protein